MWLQGKIGHLDQQIQFSFLTQLKKYFAENNFYLKISNPTRLNAVLCNLV